MNRWIGFLVAAGLVVSVALPAGAQDRQAALDAIKQYEFGQSREALTAVEDMVRETAGSETDRRKLAGAIAGLLAGDTTYVCKQFACRQLSLIGSEENVAAVAPLLPDEKTADMARYALERIPGKASDEALLAALGDASGAMAVGLINSLGMRETAAAVAALGPLAKDGDAAVADAAIAALGRIGGKGALAVLEPLATGSAQAADAYLMCADRLLADGKARQAAGIYEDVYAGEQPRRLRVAALQGVVNARGKKSVPLVLDLLASEDAGMQAIAAGLVRSMPDKGVTKAFAEELEASAPSVQVLVLDALADRGDATALPAIKKAAGSEDVAVKAAALGGLGALGSGAEVAMLADAAAHAEGDAKKAAREALARLTGDSVNPAIIELIGSGEPAVRVAVIGAATERRATEAAPTVLAAASDADEGVRKAALDSLAKIGSTADVPAVVECLVQAQTAGERKQAAKTVVTLARQIADENQRAAAVLAALQRTDNADAKCALLGTLPLIGDNSALDAVRAAATDGPEAAVDAGVRALADWPNAAPMNDLWAKLVGQGGRGYTDVQKVLMLRGFVRMVALPGDRPAAETLKLYQDAMKIAGPAEKKLILSGMANVGTKDVMAVVEGYLNDPDLKAEAQQALDKIRAKSYTATASHNAGAWKNAFDGNPGTRWDTATAMVGGEWFQVDLGWEDAQVESIVLDAAGSPGDYPRGYEVYVSNNTESLGDPVAKGKGTQPVLEITLNPNKGRYLRIVQTGKSGGLYWSIHEIAIKTK